QPPNGSPNLRPIESGRAVHGTPRLNKSAKERLFLFLLIFFLLAASPTGLGQLFFVLGAGDGIALFFIELAVLVLVVLLQQFPAGSLLLFSRTAFLVSVGATGAKHCGAAQREGDCQYSKHITFHTFLCRFRLVRTRTTVPSPEN